MSIFYYFRPISAALLPNAEKDDILLVLKLFLPWNWIKWRKGEETGELENKFKEYFGVKHAISFSSGRAGLYAILSVIASPAAAGRGNPANSAVDTGLLRLRQLADPRNDKKNEIILQAYTTIALPLAIKKAGFTPIYVDIKKETLNIDPDKIEVKITPKTKAIIVQHTFGIPAEMDKIAKIAKKHNLFLIEDCAHSLGAEFGGKKIGSFGDAAFFSFGRDKIISTTSGGMVTTSNDGFAEKIKEFQKALPFPPARWIIRQLSHLLIFWIALPIYYFFNLGKFLILAGQKAGLISRAYSKEEKAGTADRMEAGYKMPDALAILALNQFKKLDRFNNHRRKIAEIYNKELGSSNAGALAQIILPRSESEGKPAFLYYTIQAERRDELLKFAAKKHIILGDWFPGALGPKGIDEEKFGYEKGECPIAERVGLKSLNLPTNIKTSKRDAIKTANIIKGFLDKN